MGPNDNHLEHSVDAINAGDVGPVDLSESACWALLRAAPFGRLAVAIDGHPDVFPVNHLVDGNSVVFRSAAGTKLAAAVLGRAVAFEIDGYDDRAAWSVVVKGRARMIEHLEEYLAAEVLPIEPWLTGPKPNIVRVETDEVTGRWFERPEAREAMAHAPPVNQ